jgi:Protein of unknown function (DUF4031)
MTVVVDEAIWTWRGERWAHLSSDEGFGELHAFANTLGIRRLAFQGDHYDVPASLREVALGRGAVAIGSREMVAMLRATGRRVRRPRVAWIERSTDDDALEALLAPWFGQWPALRELNLTTVHVRPGEVALSIGPGRDVPTLVRNSPMSMRAHVFVVERPDGTLCDIVLPVGDIAASDPRVIG